MQGSKFLWFTIHMGTLSSQYKYVYTHTRPCFPLALFMCMTCNMADTEFADTSYILNVFERGPPASEMENPVCCQQPEKDENSAALKGCTQENIDTVEKQTE